MSYRTVAEFTYDWEYWETPDYALRYCSPSCERITGYSAPEFIGDPRLLQRIVIMSATGQLRTDAVRRWPAMSGYPARRPMSA